MPARWQKMGWNVTFAKTKSSGNGCHLLPWWWGCGIAPAEADRCGSQTGAARLQLVRPQGSQASPEQTDLWVAPTGFLAWQVEDRRRHCSTTELVFCSHVQYGLRFKSGHTLMSGQKSHHLLRIPPQDSKIFSGQSFDTSPVPLEISLVTICTAGDKDNLFVNAVIGKRKQGEKRVMTIRYLVMIKNVAI